MSTDETQPVSGSRWEPEGRSDADPTPPTEPTAATPVPAPMPPAYAVPAYGARAPRSNKGRLALAGGAVGIALIAGTGGFALGHASAGEGRDDLGGRPGFGQQGFPNNGQPPGFQNGPGGFPPGQGDDDFQDRDGDDDGTLSGDGWDDGQDDEQDDGATQGSSSAT